LAGWLVFKELMSILILLVKQFFCASVGEKNFHNITMDGTTVERKKVKESIYNQIGIAFKEETSYVLHMEHSFCRVLKLGCCEK
jgi:hypothetical protein